MRNGGREVGRFKNVLAVFPHADDETVTCGGAIRRFADAGAAVTLLLLTGGERGNPMGEVDPGLKAIRAGEAKQAARVLGISRVIQEDFGDGRLHLGRERVMRWLAHAVAEIDPDLILTYDLAGLDGHSDHVACAEFLTELRRTRFPGVRLWCVTLPGWELAVLRLSGQMRRNPRVDARRATPTHRVFIGGAIAPKIRAWSAHSSQRDAIRKGAGRLVPAWLAVSVWPFEYFAEVS